MTRKPDTFSQLRQVLALRALERADTVGDYLPMEDRPGWSREAGLGDLPEKPGAGRRLRKLTERAEVANGARMPWTVRPLLMGLGTCDLRSGTQFVVWLLAFALGVASLQVDRSGSLNLLGLPLILLLAWNLIVYLWAFICFVRLAFGPRSPGLVARMVTASNGSRAAMKRLRRERSGASGEWRQVRAFAQRVIDQWRDPFLSLAGPVLRRRFFAGLHVAAALWALGAIVGMYVVGATGGYLAYWYCPWLDVEAVRQFFAVLFFPVSKLLEWGIPPDQLELLSWTPGVEGRPDVGAEAWYHLYAATLGLFVVVPRLLLFLFLRLGARVKIHSAVSDPFLQSYFQEVRGGAAAAPSKSTWRIAVAGETGLPPEAVEEALQQWGARSETFSGIEFGAMHARLGPDERKAGIAKSDALLFAAEQTPDDAVRDDLTAFRTVANERNAVGTVFIDAGWFFQRFADLPALSDRWRDREAIWREAVGPHPLRAVFLRVKEKTPAAADAADPA